MRDARLRRRGRAARTSRADPSRLDSGWCVGRQRTHVMSMMVAGIADSQTAAGTPSPTSAFQV